MHEGVKPLLLVCGPGVANPQDETLAAWAEILKINYWPIFAIAKDMRRNAVRYSYHRLHSLRSRAVGRFWSFSSWLSRGSLTS